MGESIRDNLETASTEVLDLAIKMRERLTMETFGDASYRSLSDKELTHGVHVTLVRNRKRNAASLIKGRNNIEERLMARWLTEKEASYKALMKVMRTERKGYPEVRVQKFS